MTRSDELFYSTAHRFNGSCLIRSIKYLLSYVPVPTSLRFTAMRGVLLNSPHITSKWMIPQCRGSSWSWIKPQHLSVFLILLTTPLLPCNAYHHDFCLHLPHPTFVTVTSTTTIVYHGHTISTSLPNSPSKSQPTAEYSHGSWCSIILQTFADMIILYTVFY